MAKKPIKESCCMGCCKVDAMITVDERGQMVLPKDVRDKIGVKPGDKLALISLEKDGEVGCITLIKADKFSEIVKNMLGPMLKEII